MRARVCGRGKVSLYSNRTGLAPGEKGLQVDSDGGSKQNCHDSRSVFLVSLGPWGSVGREAEGSWTKGIDRSVQSGLKSSASHGVHGQAGGVGRSVRSSQTARSPRPSPPGM